ncbi:MAG TPA: c-type cytochrome [Burkholderiales bacterium]
MIESNRRGVALCRAAAVAIALAIALAAAAEEQATGSIAEGNSLFNQYCSHCHGPNAEQGERPRDLRRLKIRYGDNRAEVFRTTVANGRPEKGMPTWSGVLDPKIQEKIWAYLETVQQ